MAPRQTVAQLAEELRDWRSECRGYIKDVAEELAAMNAKIDRLDTELRARVAALAGRPRRPTPRGR